MNNSVVIARFNENLDWVSDLTWDYFIYNKGESLEKEYKSIPNTGREGETYIRFILEFYNELPEYVAFVQGDPLAHCSNLVSRINNAVLDSTIIYLADRIFTDNPDLALMTHNVKELGLNYNSKVFTFPTGAQYIIPRKFITNKSFAWWKKCYEVYTSDNNNPWSFERLWVLIFNHEDSI